MGGTKIQVSDTHTEPAILFIANIGIRGIGKTQGFSYIQTALKKLEQLEKEASIDNAANSPEDQNPAKRKAADSPEGQNPAKRKREDGLVHARCISYSTVQGLEDILQAKQDAGKEASLMLCVDELSGVLSSILKDKQVEASFSSLFNATPMRNSTRGNGLVDVESPRVNIIGNEN